MNIKNEIYKKIIKFITKNSILINILKINKSYNKINIIKNKNLIIILFLCYFILSYKFKSLILYSKYNNIQKTEIFYLTKNQIYLKNEIINKYNFYIKHCIEDLSIEKFQFPLLKNPKISIIMPIYNGEKYLNYSIKSIQHQRMKEIEIILIDDCSNDNSLILIKQLMKYDQRLRLIKNFENRKILFSKSIAALNSNGKYILQLDQDDIFIRDDLFNILYFEAENNNLDLVQFRDILKNNFIFNKYSRINQDDQHYIYYKKANVETQPKLKNEMFIRYKSNYLLWGLLIKSEIYKKSIYHLWPLIINYKIIFQEDYLISFMLIILTKRYKFLNYISLIHLMENMNSASNNHFYNKEFYLNILFSSYTIYNYYIKENPKDIIILYNYLNFFIDSIYISKDLFPYFFNKVIKIILYSNYLPNRNKKYIIEKLNLKKYRYKKGIINEYKINIKEFNSIYEYQKLQIKNLNPNLVEYNKPYFSIIIYCNELKHLEKTIISIINQKFQKSEIIIIYDNESIEYTPIKKYINSYKNIKLINNFNNKGLIYSLSIGVLSSSGEYIIILFPSYTFSKNVILNEIYSYMIINKNIDILEFDLLVISDYLSYNNDFKLYKCCHYKSNINLSSIKYNKDYEDIEQNKEILFNKFIKTKIFKNIINKYKLNQYISRYNYFDNIILFLLFKSKIKFTRINKYVVIEYINHLKDLKLYKIMKDKIQKIKDSIFYINFLFDNTGNNKKEKKYVLNEYYNILSTIYNKYNPLKKISKNLYKKFLNSKFIDEDEKIKLNFFYNSLLN